MADGSVAAPVCEAHCAVSGEPTCALGTPGGGTRAHESLRSHEEWWQARLPQLAYWVDTFWRMLLAHAHVANVTPLLHERKARQMCQAEIAAADVGLDE